MASKRVVKVSSIVKHMYFDLVGTNSIGTEKSYYIQVNEKELTEEERRYLLERLHAKPQYFKEGKLRYYLPMGVEIEFDLIK